MLFATAHNDSRYGGVVATFNDLLRSECTQPPTMSRGLRYNVAPTGTFDELADVDWTFEDPAGRPELIGRAMAPYFTALIHQAGGATFEPQYDDNDCCIGCNEHRSYPHADGCPLDPERDDEQFAGRTLRVPAGDLPTVGIHHVTTNR